MKDHSSANQHGILQAIIVWCVCDLGLTRRRVHMCFISCANAYLVNQFSQIPSTREENWTVYQHLPLRWIFGWQTQMLSSIAILPESVGFQLNADGLSLYLASIMQLRRVFTRAALLLFPSITLIRVYCDCTKSRFVIIYKRPFWKVV